MVKMKSNSDDRSDRVRSMKKIRQENDVGDHIGMVYAKNKTETIRTRCGLS